MIEQALRLCYVVSSEMTVSAFLKDHIAAAIAEGYQVSVVAHTRDDSFLRRLGLSVEFHSVPVVRQIAPWHDAIALLSLCCLFSGRRFDIVHSVSPKAGMLAMVAARVTGVPHRIHTFTGQVWVTRTGIKRWLLKQCDYVLAALATRALVDSPSQRAFLISEGIVNLDKTEVVGKGSICGVDSVRFRPDGEARRMVREELGIPGNAPLLLFVGRLNREKGVLDLAKAFSAISERFADARLLLVGSDEGRMTGEVMRICSNAKARVHLVGHTESPERYMAGADIFCLASYREGFGMVIIEAAAVGVPSVASRIYGITDAVIDGLTGLLHDPGDVDAIVHLLSELLSKPERRIQMGAQARRRALSDFSNAESCKALLAFYDKITN
jgi:glycosyltransferase involved in cell wall biosynthesis